MPGGTVLIRVSPELKRALEEAKGDRTWETFLQEVYAAWKGSTAHGVRGAPSEARSPVIGAALGPAFDVMKPWSMKITPQGITVEEIPRSEEQRKEPRSRKRPRA